MIGWVAVIMSTCIGAPWTPEEFPIGYWYGPPEAHNTLEAWQTVRDANFTWAMGGGYGPDGNRQMLDFCEQLGLKGLVHDSRVSWRATADEDFGELMQGVVDDYGAHPALYGYYIRDEPNYELFEALGKVSQELERRDPAHLPYINLFPTYASVKQLGTPTYTDHLEKYLSIVRPRVLSYDHYALRKDGSDRPDFFENLGLIREAGLRHNTPPWNIILSLEHFGYRAPSEGEMRWQVYCSLAYGMKGIMYFTYWTAESWEEEGHVGIVDSEGRPTKHYAIVKQLNGEMRALGKALLSLDSIGVYHTGETIPQGCRRLGSDLAVQLPQDRPLVLGLFTGDDGAEYAMIANRDYGEAQEIEVTFKPHVVGVQVISAEDGSAAEAALEEQKLALSLEPGGGRLLRLTTEFQYPTPPRPIEEINFQFDTDGDVQGWGQMHSLAPPTIAGGTLQTQVTGRDSYMVRDWLRLKADQYSKLKVRMKIGAGQSGQLFWTTKAGPGFGDDKYLNFALQADGEWHEYIIDVASHEEWRGQEVRAIRLDPVVEEVPEGTPVEIDYIVGE